MYTETKAYISAVAIATHSYMQVLIILQATPTYGQRHKLTGLTMWEHLLQVL